MKKFIFYTIKSVQEYCRTFSWRFNAGFSKFNFNAPFNPLSRLWLRCWRQSFALPLLLGAILMAGYTANAQSIKGVVPVQHPIGGDGIDGDGWAHEPVGGIYQNVGDLFDRLRAVDHPILPIVNHGILNMTDGSLLYPGSVLAPVPITYFLKDPYTNDPTTFTSSNKINDNPNTYTWGAGSSPPKNEIQNCGAHFSYGKDGMAGGVSTNGTSFSFPLTGNSGDLWCLFAGDRQVTNGSSYIDFEFLQKSLTITGTLPEPGVIDPFINTAPITGGSGTFISGAPDSTGGRTEGDLLITIEFTQGGGDATVVIRRWTNEDGPWQYKVISNEADGIKGNIFCTNNDSTTDVPFDVYGSGDTGSYAPNQWAEGAINLTQVFKLFENPCFTISTLFIRTRSSGNSEQSELKDFPGRPIQLNLNFTPIANAGADFTKTCVSFPDGKEIGEAPEAGFTYSWSPATGLSATNIANPIANPLVNTTYTVTKTKIGTTCSDTDEVTVTVNKPTVVAAAGSDFTKTCILNPDGGSIGEAAADGFTYSWISLPAGFTSTASNPSVNPSVTTTYTVTKTHTASGCSDTDEVTVTVNIALPNAVAGDDVQILCGATTVVLSGSSTTANATFAWTTLNGSIVSGADTATPTVNADGTYTLTVTDPVNGCTASDVVLVTNESCEGCTLGYWKNHTDRWCSSYTPSMKFGDVFEDAPSNLANLTLLQALNLGGGGIFNLARQGVAALLNTCSDEVDYPAPYGSNPQSVIDAVNAAYSTGGSAPGKLATQLDILNNSGCPLGGTSATKEGDGLGNKASFDAYPVPFKDQLTIRYNFDYVSDVKIDVLNSQGVSVLSKMDSNSYLNKEVTLNLNSHVDRSEVYVVKVTTNRGSSVKKVISSK